MQKLDTFSVESKYVACDIEKLKSNRFVTHSAQKIGYTACILISRIKFGHFCKHGMRNSLQFCLFSLNYFFFAILLHFQSINIGKTNKSYTNLPVTIWGIPLWRYERKKNCFGNLLIADINSDVLFTECNLRLAVTEVCF